MEEKHDRNLDKAGDMNDTPRRQAGTPSQYTPEPTEGFKNGDIVIANWDLGDRVWPRVLRTLEHPPARRPRRQFRK